MVHVAAYIRRARAFSRPGQTDAVEEDGRRGAGWMEAEKVSRIIHGGVCTPQSAPFLYLRLGARESEEGWAG